MQDGCVIVVTQTLACFFFMLEKKVFGEPLINGGGVFVCVGATLSNQ